MVVGSEYMMILVTIIMTKEGSRLGYIHHVHEWERLLGFGEGEKKMELKKNEGIFVADKQVGTDGL